MKAKFFFLTLAVVGLAFASCSDDDDDGINVPAEVENAFRSRYQNATNPKWENKIGYYVADFRQNGIESEAWFDAQGNWYMTETDIQYLGLPQAIRTTHEAGDYWTGWRVDDVDMIEAPGRETVYIIEVEQNQTDTEYDLYYSPDGIFIKAVLEVNGSSSHRPSTIPPAVQDYVTQNFTNARIVDVDNEPYGVEVDIIDGMTPRELLFTTQGTWVYTKTEIPRASVPQVVQNAVAASQYATWYVDDVDHYLAATTPTEYYVYELKLGNQEVNLRIDINGTIIL